MGLERPVVHTWAGSPGWQVAADVTHSGVSSGLKESSKRKKPKQKDESKKKKPAKAAH